MREIKFRAWDKEDKEFVTSVFNMLLRIGEPLENERFEFMQYTGLKDKNGKEIYEGDIITHVNEGACDGTEVKWKEDTAQFVNVWGWRMGEAELFEVVGNIYENPELLK